MDLSVNEFKALATKAALGAGLPPGLAVEAARASCWLSQRGLDGAGALLDALAAGAAEAGAGRLQQAEGSEWHFTRAFAAYDAPSAFDLLVAGDAQAIQLDLVDSPLLVLGQAGVAAAVYGVAIDVHGSAGNVLVTPAGVAMDALGDPSSEQWRQCTSITASLGKGLTAAAALLPCDRRIVVSDEAHSALERFAHATLVPATAESRTRGAGGGDSAND